MLLTQSPRTTASLQSLSSAGSSASYAHRSSFLRILQLTNAAQKGEVSHLETVSQKRPDLTLVKLPCLVRFALRELTQLPLN